MKLIIRITFLLMPFAMVSQTIVNNTKISSAEILQKMHANEFVSQTLINQCLDRLPKPNQLALIDSIMKYEYLDQIVKLRLLEKRQLLDINNMRHASLTRVNSPYDSLFRHMIVRRAAIFFQNGDYNKLMSYQKVNKDKAEYYFLKSISFDDTIALFDDLLYQELKQVYLLASYRLIQCAYGNSWKLLHINREFVSGESFFLYKSYLDELGLKVPPTIR